MRLWLVTISLFTTPVGFGATLHREIDMRAFAKDGLTPPRSVIPLALNRVEPDLLELQCSYSPIRIVPIPSGNNLQSSNYSRTLEFEKTAKGTTVYECAKGISCSPMSQLPVKNALRFQGSEFVYSLEGDTTALSGVVSRKPKCSSASIRVLENTGGSLQLPSGLWVLGYDSKIVFWDPVQERTWFTVQLPAGQTMEAIKSVRTNSDMRFLIEGKSGSFVLLDWLNDFAIFRKPNSPVWHAEAGLGSAAHAHEWSQNARNQQLPLLASDQATLSGTNGIVLNTLFIPWDHLNPSARGATPPIALPNKIVATSELDPDNAGSGVTLATRSDAGIRLYVWNKSKNSIEAIGEELRNDSRAKDEHYMLGGPTLFRLTSDGFYAVQNDTEIPKALRALKAQVTGYGPAFVTTDKQSQGCSMSLWMLPQAQIKIFYASIANKPCYDSHAVGVFPGGSSLSGWSGKKYQLNMSTSD